MGDQQRGLAGVPYDLSDVVAHIQACLIVQGRERLIQEQEFRIREKSANQRGALTHPAGKFGRF